MCNEVVDEAVQQHFIPHWFVTSKMIKIKYNALYSDDGLLYFDDDSGNDIFSCNEIGILSVNFIHINLLMKMILSLITDTIIDTIT